MSIVTPFESFYGVLNLETDKNLKNLKNCRAKLRKFQGEKGANGKFSTLTAITKISALTTKMVGFWQNQSSDLAKGCAHVVQVADLKNIHSVKSYDKVRKSCILCDTTCSNVSTPARSLIRTSDCSLSLNL